MIKPDAHAAILKMQHDSDLKVLLFQTRSNLLKLDGGTTQHYVLPQKHRHSIPILPILAINGSIFRN